MSGEGFRGSAADADPGRAERAAPVFRGLGPTTVSLLSLGAELNRLLDHLTRRRGSVTFSQYQLLALLRLTHPDPREPWELGRGLGSGSAQVTALLDSPRAGRACWSGAPTAATAAGAGCT